MKEKNINQNKCKISLSNLISSTIFLTVLITRISSSNGIISSSNGIISNSSGIISSSIVERNKSYLDDFPSIFSLSKNNSKKYWMNKNYRKTTSSKPQTKIYPTKNSEFFVTSKDAQKTAEFKRKNEFMPERISSQYFFLPQKQTKLKIERDSDAKLVSYSALKSIVSSKDEKTNQKKHQERSGSFLFDPSISFAALKSSASSSHKLDHTNVLDPSEPLFKLDHTNVLDPSGPLFKLDNTNVQDTSGPLFKLDHTNVLDPSGPLFKPNKAEDVGLRNDNLEDILRNPIYSKFVRVYPAKELKRNETDDQVKIFSVDVSPPIANQVQICELFIDFNVTNVQMSTSLKLSIHSFRARQSKDGRPSSRRIDSKRIPTDSCVQISEGEQLNCRASFPCQDRVWAAESSDFTFAVKSSPQHVVVLDMKTAVVIYSDEGVDSEGAKLNVWGRGEDATRKHRKRSPHHSKKMRKTNVCRRMPLYIDFAEVGWHDWIKAPHGYNAYYCGGECPAYMPQHLNATNHAAVQMMVHSIRPRQVPRPCCVPVQLSPISLLYVDIEGRVVIKNYQNMVVDACGCR